MALAAVRKEAARARHADAKAVKARVARDAAIRAAVQAGATLRSIASEAGITNALVHRIANRE